MVVTAKGLGMAQSRTGVTSIGMFAVCTILRSWWLSTAPCNGHAQVNESRLWTNLKAYRDSEIMDYPIETDLLVNLQRYQAWYAP